MRLSLLFVLVAMAAAPAVASGQAPVNTSEATAATTAPVGPRIESARLGVAPAAVEAEASDMALAAQPRLGQSVALMVVGGAALVAGLIIGGDAGTVVALGGAVIGLVGLYQYLR